MPRILFLLFFIYPFAAFADDFTFGLAADVGMVSIDDPEANGRQLGIYQAFSITGNYPLKRRDTSVVSGIGYLVGSSDASETDVGQDLAGYYIFSRFQTRLPLTRSLPNLYSYLGAKYTNSSHKGRYTVYQGYLKDGFNNRDVNTVSVGGGLGYRFQHENGRQSTPSIYLELPISGDLMFFGFQYQFEF